MAGGDWINLRVKVPAQDFNRVRTKIEGWPEEVAKEKFWPALEQIGREGADFIRYIVLTAPDKDGGGRIKTGEMYDKVQSRARERAGNAFSLFVGWNRGEPGYTIFQELGTKNGVIAMNSISQAQEYMLSQLRALAKGRYKGSS